MIDTYTKADPGPARRACAPPPSLFEFFFLGGGCFVNCDCITRVYFHRSHHAVLTICTLFSTVTNEHTVCVKGTSKQTPDPMNSTAPGPRPPVLKFLDPPLIQKCD